VSFIGSITKVLYVSLISAKQKQQAFTFAVGASRLSIGLEMCDIISIELRIDFPCHVYCRSVITAQRKHYERGALNVTFGHVDTWILSI